MVSLNHVATKEPLEITKPVSSVARQVLANGFVSVTKYTLLLVLKCAFSSAGCMFPHYRQKRGSMEQLTLMFVSSVTMMLMGSLTGPWCHRRDRK